MQRERWFTTQVPIVLTEWVIWEFRERAEHPSPTTKLCLPPGPHLLLKVTVYSWFIRSPNNSAWLFILDQTTPSRRYSHPTGCWRIRMGTSIVRAQLKEMCHLQFQWFPCRHFQKHVLLSSCFFFHCLCIISVLFFFCYRIRNHHLATSWLEKTVEGKLLFPPTTVWLMS